MYQLSYILLLYLQLFVALFAVPCVRMPYNYIEWCAQLVIVVLLMQVPTSALEAEVAKMTSESHLYYNKGL